jgi:general secretion pathway protein E
MKRLGEILIEREGVTPEQVEQGLLTQEKEGGRLGEILVKMRATTEEAVLRALGVQLGIGFSPDLRFDQIDGDLATRIPIGFSKQHRALPVKREGDGVLVATADPLDLGALDDIRAQLGTDVFPVLVPSQKILDAINHVHGQRHDKGGELGETEEEDEMAGAAEELVDILDVNDEAPIIRWVNSLLFNAVKERASDIHIEPGEKEVIVRYRIDGVLYEKRHAARQFLPSIIARVKIMAGLNIAEKRLPQDGRIRRKIAGKDIDMRVATAPTVKGGERITIRLLDRENVLHDLGDIGFGDDHLRAMDELIHRPHGILLVTGPTGSGKTTTLYAALSKINSPDLNILTIEDPVEYQLDGISQVAVNDKIDLTFATGLRSFLRHDPDVIMVGEIRDLPTAEIAIQASLTGHLVLSTIHTNDSAGAITRLVELGVQPFLVATSLVGLLAQRLVRRLCPDCRELYRPNPEELASLGLNPNDFFAGKARRVAFKGEAPPKAGMLYMAREGGCSNCLGAGYRGRTAIYELLLVDDTIRQLANKNADGPTIKKTAISRGLRTLRDDGAQKVLAGMTSAAEVLMMTAEDVE